MSRTIVVSGAALPGIGEAVTRSLISDGLRVIGTFEPGDHEIAKRLQEKFEGSLDLHEVDHSSRESIANFVARVHLLERKEIAGIVLAQAHFSIEDPLNFDHELWTKSIMVNLTAPNILIHGLSGELGNGASIVVITSTEAFVGSFVASSYAASKAAIHNLVKTHANNLGQRGIRVNAVASGWIAGVITDEDDRILDVARRLTPLKRLGTPGEVANVVSFLLSDRSSFVDGTIITVDGGYTCSDLVAKYESESAAFE